MKQTVLLTGFAGFIGSQILKDLLYRGYKVIGVDNFSAGSDISNVELPNILNTPLFSDNSDYDFTYIKKNIEKLSKEDVEVLLGDLHCSTLDYVISCAAASHVDRCYKEIDTFISSNINGPINLAKIALEMKVKKFLHVSSDEVWGEAPQPYTEETSIKTGNAYASSKASAELFLHNYCKAFGLPLIITCGANTFGKNQANEKIIPKTIYNIVSGIKIPLYKTKALRMWMHVQDHSSGVILAMENGVIGEKYCLAPELENELYTDELVRKICGLCNVSFDDVVEYVEDRPNYDLRYLMLNDKAKRELGWVPSKNIEQELPQVVDWYLKKYSK